MPGVFPDYPAPAVRKTDIGRKLSMMRWGIRHHRNPLSPSGTPTVRQQLCS
jgi:hypothetical protein